MLVPYGQVSRPWKTRAGDHYGKKGFVVAVFALDTGAYGLEVEGGYKQRMTRRDPFGMNAGTASAPIGNVDSSLVQSGHPYLPWSTDQHRHAHSGQSCCNLFVSSPPLNEWQSDAFCAGNMNLSIQTAGTKCHICCVFCIMDSSSSIV